MFDIHIGLETRDDSSRSFWLHGLDAVDFCRKYDLPIRPCIQIKDSDSDSVKVSEEFARAYFENRSKISDFEDVSLDMLMPGELVMTGQCVTLKNNLPEARILELYHAGAKRRLLQFISKLEKDIAKD